MAQQQTTGGKGRGSDDHRPESRGSGRDGARVATPLAAEPQDARRSVERGGVRGPHTPGAPARPRLLDDVRTRLRVLHRSRRTEEAYVGWIRRYILFHGKRHPTEMGSQEIQAFLNHLATRLDVAASRRIRRSARWYFCTSRYLATRHLRSMHSSSLGGRSGCPRY